MSDLHDEFTSPVFSLDTLRRAIENPNGQQVIINGVPDYTEAAPKSTGNNSPNPAKAVLFIFYFIAAIIAAVVFAQIEPILFIACIGSIFLFVGIAALFQQKLSIENLPLLIPTFAGLLMVGIPIVMLYHRSHPESFTFTQDSIITLILICFLIIGISMLVFPPILHKQKMSRCSQIIRAKCIYRNTRPASSRRANGRIIRYNLYAPTWQYELNGIIYVTCENLFSDFDTPGIGDFRDIRYNPNSPAEIYRPDAKKLLVSAIIGVMFTVISIVTLIVK